MDTKEIGEILKGIRDVSFELQAWIEKNDHYFEIRIDPEFICIQGAKSGTLYKCVEREDMNKTISQIMDEFYSDPKVLRNGLSVFLDDIALMIRQQ